MPLVRIEICAGKSAQYKADLLDSVHNALVDSLGVGDWDRFQRLYELAPDCFEYSSEKTDQFTLIELTIFPGRSRAEKRRAVKVITQYLGEAPGIRPEDIFIVINDPPRENWGLAGEIVGWPF